jgi:hypothetical protein
MEFKRLWQTLVYFDVIPWINCWQELFQGKKNNLLAGKMNYILLSTIGNNLAQATLNYCCQKGYFLKLINPQNYDLPEQSSQQIQLINKPITAINYEDRDILVRVSTFICFPEKGINNLINLINDNLQPGEILLFDFTNPAEEIKAVWGAVDDVVMGGVSASNFRISNRKAIFSGVVSTDNNGGFASVRSRNLTQPWDLSAYRGIRLRVQGDGQRYKFITRCEGKWDGISYCYSFDTLANVWMTIEIPFAELIPVFRAKTVKDAGKFDSTQVYSWQLMLSKFEYDGAYNPHFQPGAFALEIESIKAYGAENSPQLVLMGSHHQWRDFQLNTPLLKIYGESPEELRLL